MVNILRVDFKNNAEEDTYDVVRKWYQSL